MKYAFIRGHRQVWPIRIQCRLLGVSVAGITLERGRLEVRFGTEEDLWWLLD